ncbi:MAG: quaternary amine ABC transporter ATP-binding protein [Pseudomonadales bacterium]
MPSKRAQGLLDSGKGRERLLAEDGHLLALDRIDMSLEEKSIEVIMGLSGSGKSTLVRHINRLIEPSQGQVLIDGHDVARMSGKQLRQLRQQRTAMVFQNFALLPHYTVLENIGYGLQLQGYTKSQWRKTAMYWAERVGLSGFEKRYPAQLSGGMQQRVGLARALACDTDILLMDEAFSALDPLIRSDMQDILLELQRELKKTIVFITHDLDEALKIGNSIAILNQGKLIQHGSAQQILLSPADEYVARFVADVNRTSVLLAKSIMGAPETLAANSATVEVRTDDTLKQVLHTMLSADVYDAVVKDDHGRAVGHIDSDMVAEVVNA